MWFPEEIFTTWEDEPHFALPKRRMNIESLRDSADDVDNRLSPDEKMNLDSCLSKQLHSKTALYLAIEATKDWKFNNIRTNVDSAIINLLDGGTTGFKRKAKDRLYSLSDIFQFVDPKSLDQQDEALEIAESKNYKLLSIIVEEIAKNDYCLNKMTIEGIKSRVEAKEIDIDLVEEIELLKQIEAISTFANSRLGKAEKMLSITQGNDVLFALALCMKNKGKIEKIRLEKETLSQSIRRYCYIMSGLTSSMADISGLAKGNRPLERVLNDLSSIRFKDESSRLITAKALTHNDFGFEPEIYLDLSAKDFKDSLSSEEDLYLDAFYKAELFDEIPENEISSFKNPIKIIMDKKEYAIDTPESIKAFQKDFETKIKRRKTEFNKNLFLSRVFDSEKGKKLIRNIFDKYCGVKE